MTSFATTPLPSSQLAPETGTGSRSQGEAPADVGANLEQRAARTPSTNSSQNEPLRTVEVAAVLGVHERTVRRYLALGLIAYHRLPGGHYRIPQQAISDFWRDAEALVSRKRSRLGLPEQTPVAPQPSRQRRAPSHASNRSRRSAEESPAAPYDLSTAALAALRSKLS